jgi:hypothetical protein
MIAAKGSYNQAARNVVAGDSANDCQNRETDPSVNSTAQTKTSRGGNR